MTDNPITAYADPEGEVPWAMQLVVRAEKAAPPSHTHTLEAAGSATVLLLDHVAVAGTEEQQAAVARWLDGRIRKVVRRARGTAWLNARLESGRLVHEWGTATVLAFVPAPVDQVPDALRKLQVSGLALTDEGHELGIPIPDSRVRIYLNPTVELTTGKAAAQVAHAAQLTWAGSAGPARDAWVAAGAPVTVSTPTEQVWEEMREQAQVSITDAGFTEIAPGTMTCVAVHSL